MIPVHPPADHPELFVIERQRLLDDLARIDGADWSRPTRCPGWDVLDLVLHLVGDDFSVLARGRDDHHAGSPPIGDDSAFIDWLDALQRDWVAAARRISPRLATALLEWCGPQIAEHQRRADPSSATAWVSWASADLVPTWLDHARDLSEYWIHRQQIREASGEEPDLRADVLGPVLDAFRWAYPYRLGTTTSTPGECVVIDVAGSVERHWVLVAGPDGWAFSDLPPGRVVAQVEMSTDVAWRSLTSNLDPGRRSEWRATGAPGTVEVLAATRAIIGHPV